jgi:tRNA(Ile)-lysidine synthase
MSYIINMLNLNLLEPYRQQKLLVAFSGGVDSVVLSDLLVRNGLAIELAYFDHQLRPSAEIEADQEILRFYAQKYKCAYHLGRKSVPDFAKLNGLSSEDAARKLRYEFLKNLAAQEKISCLLTAHHQDDQLETMLMKFLRGSGTRGLSGIEAELRIAGITLLRPLLKVTKEQLLAYARENDLQYHEDITNQDTNFLRNQLRVNIIPALKKINPNLGETLERTAELLRTDNDYLEQQTTRIYPKLLLEKSPQQLRLDSLSLKHYPRALQRRVVRRAIEELQGDLVDISVSYIDNFLANDCNTLFLNEQNELEVKII